MNTTTGEGNCGPGKEGCQKEAAESRPEATDGGDDPTVLPDPPEKPLPTECCGSGCRPCVLDVYQEQLQEWSRLAGMSPEERAKCVAKYHKTVFPRARILFNAREIYGVYCKRTAQDACRRLIMISLMLTL